jgi:GNAT superfamily N-acetyltransferase
MHVASWRETYAGTLPDAMLSSLSIEERAVMWDWIMRQETLSASTTVQLVEHEGQIIAFGSCGSQRTGDLKDRGYDGEISAMYVLKAFQGRGVGARLLFAMASNLSTRGFSAASLWVLRDNHPARGFYERYGAQLMISEKRDVRDDAVLIEVAYGWAHLTGLN